MHQHLAAWWNGISLRTKITGVTVMLLTLGLLVSGAGTMSMLRSYLLQEVDDRVRSAAQELRETEEREGNLSRHVTITEGDCQVTAGIGEGVYMAVLDAAGRLQCDNRSGNDPSPDIADVTLQDVQENDGRPFTVDDAVETNEWRVIAEEAFLDDGLNTIVVGESLDRANDVVARFAAIFMFFALAVIVLGGVSTRLLVASTFAPLRDVEETAARFADGDFTQRLSGALPNTEVGRLSRSLNLMLARIDNAFADRARTIEQMRRFVGDASHELRTPLVSVRGYAELYRMGALGSDNDVKQAMERIENEAVRMSELVSDLLELARLDETRPLNLREIDLGPIAHDAALDARASAPDRTVSVVPLEITEEEAPEPSQEQTGELTLTGGGRSGQSRTAAFAGAQLARLRSLRTRSARRLAEAPPEEGEPTQPRAIVLGEENKIRQVVTNLMGNAQRYSPPGSPIELGVGVDLGKRMGVIAIIDHGRGIPPQMRDKIFQRFWRADTSRTRETGGSGLGLAIVAAIVASHGGKIEVDETPGGGATFRVLLPLAPSFADPTPEYEVD
ncbi:MAG: HAMP domain-containing histidine kinase [Actinomycetota bacterium]|nr:HAMP domain-containing histidine kinase [Actinomycetota bacterium]